MGEVNLVDTVEERDLGVLIELKFDFGKNIRCIVGINNNILGVVRISLACSSIPMFFNHYTFLVCSLLENCVQV